MKYPGSANLRPKALFFCWFGAITTLAFHASAGITSVEPNSNAATPLVAESTTSADQIPTWREATLTLTIDPSFGAIPNGRLALERAVSAWTSIVSELPAVQIVEAVGSESSLTVEQRNLDHRISFAAAGASEAKGALAITLIAVNSDADSIIDADIVVNGAHHFEVLDENGKAPADAHYRNSKAFLTHDDPTTYDLQNVLAHELGHWFGLRENYEDPLSTMYAYVEPNEVKKRDLTADDIDVAQLAYWQADNPSENTGCSLSGSNATRHANSPLGLLAAALFSLSRSNRRRIYHVLVGARRLVTATPQTSRSRVRQRP